MGERVIAEGRVLVTGQMRSGTTMLASFLNSQAEICMIPDALRIPAAALNTFGTSVGPSDLLDGGARKRLWRAMLHVSLNNPATPQVERTVIDEEPDVRGLYPGSLLFVCWSPAGDRPVGHVETELPRLIALGRAPDAMLAIAISRVVTFGVVRSGMPLRTAALRRLVDEGAEHLSGARRVVLTVLALGARGALRCMGVVCHGAGP